MHHLQQRLVTEGQVELVVWHRREGIRLHAMIDALLTARPGHCVVVQQRQNDPQQWRLIFTRPEEALAIWRQPGPWDAETEPWGDTYVGILNALHGLDIPEEIHALLEEIYSTYLDAVLALPHPDNPYVSGMLIGGHIGIFDEGQGVIVLDPHGDLAEELAWRETQS